MYLVSFYHYYNQKNETSKELDERIKGMILNENNLYKFKLGVHFNESLMESLCTQYFRDKWSIPFQPIFDWIGLTL